MQDAIDVATGTLTRTQTTNILRVVRSGVTPDDCTAEDASVPATASAPPPELTARIAELTAHAELNDDRFISERAAAVAQEAEAAGDIDDAAQVWFLLARTGYDVPTKVASDAARKAATLAAQIGDADLSAQAWAIAAKETSFKGEIAGVDAFIAAAELEASRSPRPMTRIFVDIDHGFIEKQRAHYAAARELCLHAYQRATASYGEDSEAADAALGCLFNVAYQRDRFAEAMGYAEQRAGLHRKIDGSSSGTYFEVALSAEICAMRLHDPTARVRLKVLVDRMEAAYGPDALGVMHAYYEWAVSESEDGAIGSPEALAVMKKALAIAMTRLPPDDIKVGQMLEMEADILESSGNLAEALPTYDRALAIYDRVHNVHFWAPVAYNTADGYRNDGQCDHAMPLLARLIQLEADGELGESSIGPTSRAALGTCETQTGAYDQGIARLSAAIADLDQNPDAANFAAQFRVEAAQAYAAHGDAAHARALVHEVLALLPIDADGVHRQLREAATQVLAKKR
jgi:tetratricopeptide (TPR) repeat protein